MTPVMCAKDWKAVVLAVVVGACAIPAAQGKKIFYIGNSLTDQSYGTHEVAVGKGYTGCGWTKYTSPGAPIRHLWDNAENNVVWMDASHGYGLAGVRVKTALQNYAWDALVLQLFSYNGDNAQTMIEKGGNFAELAYSKNPDCQVYVFGSYSDVNGNFGTTKGNHESVNALFDEHARDAVTGLRARFPNRKPALVVPVSLAFTEMAKKIGGHASFYKDDIHATRESRYVQVMTLFATIYNADPHGAVITGMYQWDDKGWGVSSSFAETVWDVVWDVVRAHPMAGFGTVAAALPVRGTSLSTMSTSIRNAQYDLAGRPVAQRTMAHGLKIATIDGQSVRPFVAIP